MLCFKPRFLFFGLVIFALGCSHLKGPHFDGERGESGLMSGNGQAAQGGSGVQEDQGELVPKEVNEAASHDSTEGLEGSRIPLEINQAVLNWVDYFKGRGRKHMERYLERSTRYLSLMKKILREEGVPEDLVYLALIESGYNAVARSHANAVGYWQFIRGTGKRYSLTIDHLIDDRRDPELSTRAAAQYLKSLYNLFGSWYLAIISYNVGENRVKNVVMKYQTRDFWEMARRKKLPRETIHYLPKFFAATLIAKDPERYGFTDLQYEPPIEFDVVKITHPISLKKFAEGLLVDSEELKRLNPKFRTDAIPVRGFETDIRVPLGRAATIAQALESSKITQREISSASEAGYIYYRVRHGDSLFTIARRFRTTVVQLREINNLSRGAILRVGRRLRVPDREGTSGYKQQANSEKRFATKNSPKRKGIVHLVRRGETLSSIASRYKVSVSEIVSKNQLKSRSHLYAGASLRIPHRTE